MQAAVRTLPENPGDSVPRTQCGIVKPIKKARKVFSLRVKTFMASMHFKPVVRCVTPRGCSPASP